MNKLITTLMLSLVAFNSFAADLKTIEVKPPYVKFSCSNGETDYAGAIGLSLNKFTATEKNEEISISLANTVSICTVAKDQTGKNVFSAKEVNPYAGYDVQYFNFKTSSIDLRHEVIDSAVPANRFETNIFINSSNKLVKGSLLKSQSTNSSIETQLKIAKADLLDQNDIDTLEKGLTVSKMVTLFSVLNTTSTINGEKILMGDINFSGRNIVFVFTKVKNNYKLMSVSL